MKTLRKMFVAYFRPDIQRMLVDSGFIGVEKLTNKRIRMLLFDESYDE